MDIGLRDNILAELLPVLGLDYHAQTETFKMGLADVMGPVISDYVESEISERDSDLRVAVDDLVDAGDVHDDLVLIARLETKLAEVEKLRERIDELVDADEDPDDDDARIRLIDAKISDASNAGDLWRDAYWDLRGGDRDLYLGPEDAAATEAERGPEADVEPWEEHYRDLRADLAEAAFCAEWDRDAEIESPLLVRRAGRVLINEVGLLQEVNLSRLFDRHRAELSRALAEALNPRITIQAGGIEIGPAIIASDIVRLLSPAILTALCLGEDATEEQVLERIGNCSAVFCLLGADLDWPVARVDAQIDTISDGAYSNWIQVCSHLGVNADRPAKDVIAWIDNREETPIVLDPPLAMPAGSVRTPIDPLTPIRARLGLDDDAKLEQILARISAILGSSVNQLLAAGGRI